MMKIWLHLTGTNKLRLNVMSKVEFKLDTKAVRSEILQADYMQNLVTKEAEKMSNADSHVKSFIGFDRAKAIIYPNTKEHK